jgi:hypothetical protein
MRSKVRGFDGNCVSVHWLDHNHNEWLADDTMRRSVKPVVAEVKRQRSDDPNQQRVVRQLDDSKTIVKGTVGLHQDDFWESPVEVNFTKNGWSRGVRCNMRTKHWKSADMNAGTWRTHLNVSQRKVQATLTALSWGLTEPIDLPVLLIKFNVIRIVSSTVMMTVNTGLAYQRNGWLENDFVLSRYATYHQSL